MREWLTELGVTLTPALATAWAQAEDVHHRARREGRVAFDEHRRRRRRDSRPLAGLPVGDDHPVDVVGARAAGMPAVHLDRAGTGPAREDHRLTSLHGPAGVLRSGALGR